MLIYTKRFTFIPNSLLKHVNRHFQREFSTQNALVLPFLQFTAVAAYIFFFIFSSLLSFFDNVFEKAVLPQDITNSINLLVVSF